MFFKYCWLTEKIRLCSYTVRGFKINFAKTCDPGLRVRIKIDMQLYRLWEQIYITLPFKAEWWQGLWRQFCLEAHNLSELWKDLFMYQKIVLRTEPHCISKETPSGWNGSSCLLPSISRENSFFLFLAYNADIKSVCTGHLTWLLLCWPRIRTEVWGTM